MGKPETIVLKLHTVTPLWTGGIKGMDYIKGSSIIGGLRFLAEAYFRSIGKDVCNITEINKCIYEEQKKNICSVCNIFGCTGISRSFLLKISTDKWKTSQGGRISVRKCINKQGKPATWYLKSAFIGNFSLELSPVRGNKINPLVLFLLRTMIYWTSMGAQDQYGYGVVGLDNVKDNSFKVDEAIFNGITTKGFKKTELPSLNYFFFFTGKVKKVYRELPFEIRCNVREKIRTNYNNKTLRHYFCGAMGDYATKYNLSLTPDGILKGWGWFPEGGRFGNYRDKCLNILEQEVSKYVNGLKWKEFNSSRDNVDSAKDWPGFLKEIAKGSLKDL